MEKIKAVILAAGLGTRMKPFSFSESKTMIPFLGKPLLAHHVDEFVKNNIKNFIIVCNKNNIKSIKNYFGKFYSDYKFNYAIQKEQLGPSHAIYMTKDYLNKLFIVKYGDSISAEDQIASLIKKYNEDESVEGVATLTEVKNPEEYGIAEFDSNKQLIKIIEKPKINPPSNYANVGLFLLKKLALLSSLNKIWTEEVVPPIEYLLRCQKKISYWITKARRVDVGRPINILEATQLFIDKFGGKLESHNLSNAKISQKAYIGPDAILDKDVEIGNYSHINCYVGRGTKLSNTYIMDNTKVGKNCNIMHSAIGRNNIIGDNFTTLTNNKLGVFTGENVIISDNLKSYSDKVVFPNKLITQDIKKDLLISAIFFDIDNTLLKTKEIAKQADMAAMQILAKNTNHPLNILYQKWKEIVSQLQKSKDPKERTRKYSYFKLANLLNLNKKITKNAYNSYLKNLISSIKPNEHVHETLQLLKKYKLAAFTEDSKETTLAKLKATNLHNYFDIIITNNDTKIMKPHLDYYNKIFQKLNVSPNECLVIGDNYENDLEIAKNLGCKTISFGNDKRADYQINNFKELLKILKNV